MLTAIVGYYYFFYSAIYPLMDTISMDMVARGQLSSYGNVRIMTTLGYILSVSLTERCPASIRRLCSSSSSA